MYKLLTPVLESNFCVWRLRSVYVSLST